jgi:hypothetical protein
VTDYLDRASVTNELAVLTPYELSFRCFSTELASVLTGFASSPFSLVVKGFNVEPAAATTAIDPITGMPMTQGFTDAPTPIPIQTYIPQPVPNPSARQTEADMFARRYGSGKGSYGPPPVTAPQPVPTIVAPAQPKVQTVLDERQLKVTMLVYVIKLLPPKS